MTSANVDSLENSTQLICPSVAIKYPAAFIKATEHLFAIVRETINHICCDLVIYNRTWNKAEVSSLLHQILTQNILRRAELSFWFRLSGNQANFKILADYELVSALSLTSSSVLKDSAPTPRPASLLSKGIAHMGHAGVYINETARCLIDPVFFEENSRQTIEPINMTAIGDVEAVFFTHHHVDHFDLGSLVQIPRHIPLFIPSCLNRRFEPDMRTLLKKLNFENVTEVSAGDRISLSGQAYVDILPFYGEGREIVPFEAYCPLYSSQTRRILFHADSGPNYAGESLLNSSELERCLKDGPIDTIFGTWWQAKCFVFELSPMTLLSENLSSSDWLATIENCNCTIPYIMDLTMKIGAQKFVTYAERGGDIFNEAAAQSGYIPLTSFFWKNRNEYVKALGEINIEMLEAIPRRFF